MRLSIKHLLRADRIIALAVILVVLGGLRAIILNNAVPRAVIIPPRTYWPTAGWRESSPEAQGIDSGALNKLDQHIQQNLPNLFSVLIVRHGYLVFERYYGGYEAELPFEVASVTKSITSALVGIALDKGYLKSLDEPVTDFFPKYADDFDTLTPTITMRHVMSMTTGFNWTEDGPWYWPDYSSWMQFALSMQVTHPPGTYFTYNTPSVHLLSGVLTQSTGMSLADFAQKNLFTPLGIPAPQWGHDPDGYTTGAHALHLRARDMAKFGYLYLNRGKWEGKQLIPAAWVDMTTAQYSDGGFPQGTPYGYLWWVTTEDGHPAYFAAGYGGQYVMVIPDLDSVVVMTSATDQPHPEHRDLIGDYIVPAMQN
ncbi:MAG: serine hydrolase [Chloroflexota bacterium]